MTREKLKGRIKNRVEQERLDESQFTQLQNLIQSSGSPNTEQPRAGALSRRSFLAGMATAAGLAGMGLGVWQLLRERSITPETLSAEVLRNHQERKSLDITTNRFEQMQNFFSAGLDFNLTRSRAFPDEKLALEGGRYCSLNGIRAVQILFRRPDDSIVTLYQTRHHPDRFRAIPSLERGEAPLGIERNSYRVSLWVESGLLMATAEPL